jgi:FkbM family methyltransferase
MLLNAAVVLRAEMRRQAAIWAPRMELRRRLARASGEPEIALLPALCDQRYISIDVGANWGSYTAHLAKVSRQVFAFEPVPEQAAFLRAAFRAEKVAVIERAVSKKGGRLPLFLDGPDFALSSLKDSHSFGKNTVEVDVCCLDELSLPETAFVKIDVEGHELEVLHGAEKLLERDFPCIVVEAEERHRQNAVDLVQKYLNELGYEGWFLIRSELHPMSVFDVKVHQNIASLLASNKESCYINNFIYLPRNSSEIILNNMKALLPSLGSPGRLSDQTSRSAQVQPGGDRKYLILLEFCCGIGDVRAPGLSSPSSLHARSIHYLDWS